MPLSLVNTLALDKPRLSSILLQLENGSIACSEGVIEDVLLKVGKFIFTDDFIVLNF